jgi:membrane-associated protein
VPAPFVPVVRTLTPLLAGIGEMARRTFTIDDIVGAAIWAIGVSVAG